MCSWWRGFSATVPPGGTSQLKKYCFHAARLRASGYGVAATTRRPERVAADRPFLDLSRPVEDWPIPGGMLRLMVDRSCVGQASVGRCRFHRE